MINDQYLYDVYGANKYHIDFVAFYQESVDICNGHIFYVYVQRSLIVIV